MRYLFITLFLFAAITSNAQQIGFELIKAGNSNHFRGISSPTQNVIWVSGTKGTIGRSIDGGKTWHFTQVQGFEKTDFRDIEAFNKKTAVIMGIDSPAVILKTIDGGLNWKTVYRNDKSGMFLDALDFYTKNKNYGAVIGDPVGGKFFIATTSNKGKTWTELPYDQRPFADSGEACFAASGSNIKMTSKKSFLFVSGGMSSKLYFNNKGNVIPIKQGNQSSGANSVSQYSYKKIKRIIITGGDFANDTIQIQNCIYSLNQGANWTAPNTPPKGYRSAIAHIKKNELISCGTNGIDYSTDGGKTWSPLSKLSFHCIAISKKGKAIYLAGANGQIGKIK